MKRPFVPLAILALAVFSLIFVFVGCPEPKPKPTVIRSVDIIINAPINGATPGTTASTDDIGYTLSSVSWSPAGNRFLGSTAYTASLTLTADKGYTFTGLNIATINLEDATVSNNNGTAVTLSYTFPQTDIKTVTDIAIKTQPDKLEYIHGETLELAGLVVTLTYDDTTTEDVAAASFTSKNITASLEQNTGLIHLVHNNNSVKITFGDFINVSTSNLTVNPKVFTFDVDSIVAQTYTGNAFTPTVTVKDNTEVLALDTDYTVDYADNTDAGTATVTITGVGNYEGSSGSVTFTINPKIITFTVDSIATQTYTGNAFTPTVTVKDNTEVLTLNTDYTVEYINNTNAGTATINVTGAGNYAGSSGSVNFTILQTVSPDRFEYYWVDEHGSLVTTSGGTTNIAIGATLTITAQGAEYIVQSWYLNGINTGQDDDTFTFSSTTTGKHTVDLFVVKDNKLYSTEIVVMVILMREITINMYDSYGDGWDGNGALRINVNGVDIATNVKVQTNAANNIPSGQRNRNTYTFNVVTGDVVQLYWIAGSSQGENSFIVYYTDTPPSPVFTTSNQGPTTWSGSNALLFRVQGNAPNGLTNVTNGTLLGSFTVQ